MSKAPSSLVISIVQNVSFFSTGHVRKPNKIYFDSLLQDCDWKHLNTFSRNIHLDTMALYLF